MKVKIRAVMVVAALVIGVQLAACLLILRGVQPRELDAVAVNELAHVCGQNWRKLEAGKGGFEPESFLPPNDFSYCIMNNEGETLYSAGVETDKTLYDAVAHRDTVVDIVTEGQVKGKLIIENRQAAELALAVRRILWVLLAEAAVLGLLLFMFLRYLIKTVFVPFERLREFASRVACGNLELPLEMDRDNIFGAFTESFDLMREELKRARERERAADKSKKELVAQLSHDIKTPIASIKAIAEVMGLRAGAEKERQQLMLIQEKADQVDALISNLFQGTLEELEELKVEPVEQDSRVLGKLLAAADYDGKAEAGDIPACLVSFDTLRMQQVFDNIIANSYKYAGTAIQVSACLGEGALYIRIRDYGPGVPEKELPLIKGKFYRGRNASGKSGTGLGLYISGYLLSQMGGSLTCRNEEPGFCVTVGLPI